MKRFNFVILTALAILILSCNVFASDIPTPSGYYNYDYQKIVKFLELEDEDGVKNGSKLSSNYSPYNPSTWGKGSRYSLTDSKWSNTKRYNNIEWTKDETGFKRIGKIDFQIAKENQLLCADVVGELDTNGFTSLELLQYYDSSISNFNLGYVPNLKYLYIDNVNHLDLNGAPNIEILSCSDSTISYLDLSNTPNLWGLDCNNTLITSLDLIKIPKLKNLSIGNTRISNLDLNKVPELENLYCPNTSILELNLSMVPKLQTLYCSNTQISNLNLNNVPNLQTLFCDNTLMSNLDLSKLSNLERLDCSGALISTLDLSNISNLNSLHCDNTLISNLNLSNVSNLEYLHCNNTSISNLNLSNVPNLKQLGCDNTLISSLDLSKVPNLEYLDCQRCKLSINELRNIKLNYSHLYDKKFENQNIFDSYIFPKGDISNFGNETSTYKWYADDVLIEDISTPTYDLSDYKGKKVKCEITDGDITLKSNKPTVIGIEFENPPKDINKGTKIKLSAVLNTFDIESIGDTSVSWSIYNTENSSIDINGNLNVAENETSKYITIRATSNFNPQWYEEIKILINSNCEDPLKEAIEYANKINNKEDASVGEIIEAIIKLSKAIQDYENNCVKP